MKINNNNSYYNQLNPQQKTFRGKIHDLTPKKLEQIVKKEYENYIGEHRTTAIPDSEKQAVYDNLVSCFSRINTTITNKFSPLVCFKTFLGYYENTSDNIIKPNEYSPNCMSLIYPYSGRDRAYIYSRGDDSYKVITDLSADGLEKERYNVENTFLDYLQYVVENVNPLTNEFDYGYAYAEGDWNKVAPLPPIYWGIDLKQKPHDVLNKISEIVKSTYDWIEKNPDVYPSELKVKLFDLKKQVDTKLHHLDRYNNLQSLKKETEDQNRDLSGINTKVVLDENGNFIVEVPKNTVIESPAESVNVSLGTPKETLNNNRDNYFNDDIGPLRRLWYRLLGRLC